MKRLATALVSVVALASLSACSLWSDDGVSGSGDTPGAKPRPVWAPTVAEMKEARAKADALSLDDLAGQLLIARHFSDDSSLALVRDRHFAGDMVTGDRILDVTTSDPLSHIIEYNAQLRQIGAERGIPVLIPIDQEGGLVARLRAPLTEFGTFMTAGAALTGDPKSRDVLVAAAKASGAELKGAGFNAVFAPVGDVTIGPADPIIGSRSAGSNAQVVAHAVTATVEGYGEAGLLTTVKHFPGHNVDTDSHARLPRLTSDAKRLRSHDFVPFKAAIALQAPGIMTGHLDVRYIDPGVPASLSRKVITDGLRKNLGFDGLVVSDSLGMGAVNEKYKHGTAALEALKAGSDLALMPANNIEAYDAVLAALKSGDYSEKQARDSATRVIAYALHAQHSTARSGTPGDAEQASVDFSAAGLSLATCEPVEPLTSVVPRGNEKAVARFREAALAAGLGTTRGPSLYLAGRGIARASADIAVTLDTPYALSTLTAPTKLAVYGDSPGAMRALVDFLLTGGTPPGALPVDVNLPAC